MKPTSPTATESSPAIRVHLTDGSVHSFTPTDTEHFKKMWQTIEPGRVFSLPRIVVAGEHYKSVFVTAHVARVDFMRRAPGPWAFPGGYADVVELDRQEFRKHAHLDEPHKMVRREECTPIGDLLVSFSELRMLGGASYYIMSEVPVGLPAENRSLMRVLIGRGAFHMRLACGGFGVINLANLVSFTVYPGVPDVPVDTWLAEPVTRHD